MTDTKSSASPAAPRSFTQSGVNLIALNEDVLEKLKILGYEQEIKSKRPSLKPLHRTYFAIVEKKSADPFKWYEALVGWLLKLMKVDHLEWNEFDDPNEICEACVEQIRKLGYTGDLTTTKLRSGSGESVLLSLDWLCERALEKKRFKIVPPAYAESTDAEEAAVDDEAEINDEVIEEEAIAEEEEYMGAAIGHTEETKMSQEEEEERQRQAILESKVDPVEWNLELERVGPQLKIRPQPAAKEWRTHLEQSAKHEKQLAEAFPPAKTSLEKMANKLHEVVQRIESKESHMNTQFKHLGNEFRSKQEILDKIQQEHQTLSESIARMDAIFEEKEAEVRSKETQLSERHNSVTDAAPLKRIQNSLAGLKKEVGVMELRIGVVGQTLLQSKLKHQMMHAHHNNTKQSTSPLNRLAAHDDDD